MKKFLLFIFTFFILGFFASYTYGQNSFYGDTNTNDTTKTNFYELQKLKLYPNPASEYLYVDYDILYVKEAEVKIYNSIGSVIYSKELESKHDNLKIPVTDFDNGLYFCSLQIDGKLLNTKKVLINHH